MSPAIHSAAFRRLGLDWVYLALPVPPRSLGPAVAGLRALGAAGVNVTMPHKEAVAGHLDQLAGDAEGTGAVNTVVRAGERLVGHNTDVEGFREFVSANAGYDLAGKRAVVLGAGGAARAVVKALEELGATGIVVVARDEARAKGVREIAAEIPVKVAGWSAGPDEASGADVVVNATPIGARGERLLEGTRFGPGQLVVDLIYMPPSTPLVEAARRDGADAWGGLGMLVHQAAASFRIWTGREPPVETMSAAAVHAIGSTRKGTLPTQNGDGDS